MSAPMMLAMLLLGAFLGVLAGALLGPKRMPAGEGWSYLLGGAFGGLLAATCLNPHDINPGDIVLMALSGFAMSVIVHRLVRGDT